MKLSPIFFILLTFLLACSSPEPEKTDVLIIGAGTGAISAGIQSARSGANTILVNPLPWVGGMLTAAGVSAIDGNHELPSGMWGEFRDSIRNHYGGTDSVSTGWVSFTLFEPHVGEKYLRGMANAEAQLSIWGDAKLIDLKPIEEGWEATIEKDEQTYVLQARVLIDGTDLGDVAAMAGANFDIGMDSRTESGEAMAPASANDILQDLTYVAILKDYGEGQDKTIPRPADYDPRLFYCSCQSKCDNKEDTHPCETMMTYAKLPNEKYMINWPIEGNDYYANILELDQEAREAVYEKAKSHTLNFVYYIQNELGYKNLGLADDEFPSADHLALLPYHREGRRIKGLTRLNVNHILKPFDSNIYRTGIAVGDYPIDHHHDKNLDAPEINFPQVPSFNVPIGALIPKGVDNLIIADKAISVTNIVNGSTRLQPVILQIGQVAGAMAAMASTQNEKPSELDIRTVQSYLLKRKVYLMPYIDVKPEHPYFESIQRVGAAGLLKGKGVPYKWANQTWFYPDTTVVASELQNDLQTYHAGIRVPQDNELLTIGNALKVMYALNEVSPKKRFPSEKSMEAFLIQNRLKMGFTDLNFNRNLTKGELAVLFDKVLEPFQRRKIDFSGNWK